MTQAKFEPKGSQKPTPGPWTEGYKNVWGQYHIGTIARCVCTIHANSLMDSEAAANARLIAAAPDLLNICEQVLTDWHNKSSNMQRKEPGYLEKIRQAIAKATKE